MNKASTKKPPTTPNKAVSPNQPHEQEQANDSLRVHAQTLKELVSLEKIEQELLHSGRTGTEEVTVAPENAYLCGELQETFLNAAAALTAAVEKKDSYTGGHIMRVEEYSMAIAKHLLPPLSDIDQLRLAAVLHDIGKIGIKDSVLLKPGKLTTDEMAHMREHPLVGDDMMGHIEQMNAVRKVTRSHHEKWDGSGYPDGLKGESIPLHARIILVADTLDAMTTDRPYRKATDLSTAVEEVKRFMGKEFDPTVAEAFFKACECGDIVVNNGTMENRET